MNIYVPFYSCPIQPPSGFAREVWEELAAKGFLKSDGGGSYELVEGK